VSAAVTRGKKLVVIVGSRRAISLVVRNTDANATGGSPSALGAGAMLAR
jgi:ATP-dependent exoDNAse (exonuclease V) alpha subunit